MIVQIAILLIFANISHQQLPELQYLNEDLPFQQPKEQNMHLQFSSLEDNKMELTSRKGVVIGELQFVISNKEIRIKEEFIDSVSNTYTIIGPNDQFALQIQLIPLGQTHFGSTKQVSKNHYTVLVQHSDREILIHFIFQNYKGVTHLKENQEEDDSIYFDLEGQEEIGFIIFQSEGKESALPQLKEQKLNAFLIETIKRLDLHQQQFQSLSKHYDYQSNGIQYSLIEQIQKSHKINLYFPKSCIFKNTLIKVDDFQILNVQRFCKTFYEKHYFYIWPIEDHTHDYFDNDILEREMLKFQVQIKPKPKNTLYLFQMSLTNNQEEDDIEELLSIKQIITQTFHSNQYIEVLAQKEQTYDDLDYIKIEIFDNCCCSKGNDQWNFDNEESKIRVSKMKSNRSLRIIRKKSTEDYQSQQHFNNDEEDELKVKTLTKQIKITNNFDSTSQENKSDEKKKQLDWTIKNTKKNESIIPDKQENQCICQQQNTEIVKPKQIQKQVQSTAYSMDYINNNKSSQKQSSQTDTEINTNTIDQDKYKVNNDNESLDKIINDYQQQQQQQQSQSQQQSQQQSKFDEISYNSNIINRKSTSKQYDYETYKQFAKEQDKQSDSETVEQQHYPKLEQVYKTNFKNQEYKERSSPLQVKVTNSQDDDNDRNDLKKEIMEGYINEEGLINRDYYNQAQEQEKKEEQQEEKEQTIYICPPEIPIVKKQENSTTNQKESNEQQVLKIDINRSKNNQRQVAETQSQSKEVKVGGMIQDENPYTSPYKEQESQQGKKEQIENRIKTNLLARQNNRIQEFIIEKIMIDFKSEDVEGQKSSQKNIRK